jgi:hypothetical protein
MERDLTLRFHKFILGDLVAGGIERNLHIRSGDSELVSRTEDDAIGLES